MPKFVLATTSFLVALVCVYLLIAYLVYGHSDIFLKTEKDEYVSKYIYFKKYKDEFDTVFVGSSKVYRQIDAKLFDELTGTRSFNFGVNGLTPPANIRLLEKILALKPAKLKTVVLELEFLRTIREYYQAKELFYNFDPIIDIETIVYRDHDWQNLGYVFAGVFLKYSRFVQACMAHPKPYREQHIGSAGYVPLDSELGKADDTRKEFLLLRHSALKSGEIARFPDLNMAEVEANAKNNLGFYESLLKKVLKQCDQEGLELVFLITPRSPINRIYRHHWHFLKNDKHRIIEINSPAKYPELYLLENSFDRNHLNSKGAEIFTRILAEEYIR